MAKYPWPEIKAEYVEGINKNGEIHYPTLEELARKHGCSESSVRKRSAKEDWATERNIYCTKIEQKTQEKKSTVLAGKAAEFDAKVYQITDTAIEHVKGHFFRVQQQFKDSKGTEPMNEETLERLSRTLEKYQKVGKEALGEETESMKEKTKLVVEVEVVDSGNGRI